MQGNGPILAVPVQDQGWAYLSIEPHTGYAFQKGSLTKRNLWVALFSHRRSPHTTIQAAVN